MGTTKKKWKTAQFGLPVPLFADWRPKQTVRICGDDIQVQVVKNVPLPHSYTVAEYIKELSDAAEGLIDDDMEFFDATEQEGSEIRVKGWRLPTEAELAIIREESDSATWRDLIW